MNTDSAMANDEIRMTKEFQSPKSGNHRNARHSSLLRDSFFHLRQSALIVVCFISFLITSASIRAQTGAPDEARKVENRFLFILDTSSAMSGFAPAAHSSVLKLLNSQIQGQMRAGDTFGIWTYNEKLNTSFPMQVWSDDSREFILQNVTAFLSSLRYEKKARLEKVFPPMNAVIRASPTLTVIFISDGISLFQGTPFDSDINDLHKEYGPPLRAANVPFLTVLAARNGELFDYTVNSSISTVRIPETAEPIRKTATPPTNVVVAAAKAPVIAAPAKPRPEINLIHPQKTNVAAVPVPTEPISNPPVPAAPISENKLPAPVTPSPTVVAPPPTPKGEPVAVSPVQPTQTPTVNPAAVETKPSPAVVPPAPAPRAAATRVEPNQAPPKTEEARPIPVAVPAPAPIAIPVSPSVPVATAPKSSPPTANVSAPVPGLTEKKTEPATVSAPSVISTEKPNVKEAPTQIPSPQTAIVVTSTFHTGTWILFSAAVVLLLIAVGLLLFILRRSRPAESSLISQSMNKVK